MACTVLLVLQASIHEHFNVSIKKDYGEVSRRRAAHIQDEALLLQRKQVNTKSKVCMDIGSTLQCVVNRSGQLMYG